MQRIARLLRFLWSVSRDQELIDSILEKRMTREGKVEKLARDYFAMLGPMQATVEEKIAMSWEHARQWVREIEKGI